MARATRLRPEQLFQQLVGERPVDLRGPLDDLRGQEVDHSNPAGSVVGDGFGVVGEDRLDRGANRGRVTDLRQPARGDDLGRRGAIPHRLGEHLAALVAGDLPRADERYYLGEVDWGGEPTAGCHLADNPVGRPLVVAAGLGRGLEEVSEVAVGGDQRGVSDRQAVLSDQPRPPRAGELRKLPTQIFDPRPVQLQGREVGFGEVPIILGEFLAPLGEGPLLRLRPAPCLLHYRAA